MRFDYCNSQFYGLPYELVQRLQRVQNCAARLVSKRKLPSRSLGSFFFDNHWLQVKFRPVYKILTIVHNCLHHCAPEDIKSMLAYGESRRTLHLNEPVFNNKFGKRSFSRSGPKLWNLLPFRLRLEKKTEKFKKDLKSFLMLEGDAYLLKLDQR